MLSGAARFAGRQGRAFARSNARAFSCSANNGTVGQAPVTNFNYLANNSAQNMNGHTIAQGNSSLAQLYRSQQLARVQQAGQSGSSSSAGQEEPAQAMAQLGVIMIPGAIIAGFAAFVEYLGVMNSKPYLAFESEIIEGKLLRKLSSSGKKQAEEKYAAKARGEDVSDDIRAAHRVGSISKASGMIAAVQGARDANGNKGWGFHDYDGEGVRKEKLMTSRPDEVEKAERIKTGLARRSSLGQSKLVRKRSAGGTEIKEPIAVCADASTTAVAQA